MIHRLCLTNAVMAIILTLLSPVFAEDSLERRMRALSPEAHDCGRTDRSVANRRTVLACVKSQVAAGTPFRVRFDDTCIDSICAWGLVREKQEGPIRIVPYDPKMCPPAVANDTDPWCGTFGVVPCKNPKVIVHGEKLRIECEDYVF